MIGPLTATALTWMGISIIDQRNEKARAQWVATMLAQQSGKPIINIGAGCDPFGNVRCDVFPQCFATYCDAKDLGQYGDGQFGVAFLSHVLEHVDDPVQVLREARRVADNVVVVIPNLTQPLNWVHPGHKYLWWQEPFRLNLGLRLVVAGLVGGVVYLSLREVKKGASSGAKR